MPEGCPQSFFEVGDQPSGNPLHDSHPASCLPAGMRLSQCYGSRFLCDDSDRILSTDASRPSPSKHS